jgi:hypothetical protein
VFFRRPAAASGPQYLKPDGQNAFRVRVKTSRHGEIVEVRFTKSGDISPTESGFFVRKHIVSSRHYDRAVLEVSFGRNYANPQVNVEGGEAVPVTAWD